jgi:hypothetical protein
MAREKEVAPAAQQKILLYSFGDPSIKTTCRLSFKDYLNILHQSSYKCRFFHKHYLLLVQYVIRLQQKTCAAANNSFAAAKNSFAAAKNSNVVLFAHLRAMSAEDAAMMQST